jgi:hypothetical protein
MRSDHAMVVVLTCASSVALAQQHCSSVNVDRSSSFCTVPDPILTPGEMDESLACISNVDRPRQVTEAEKNAILKAYGAPADTDKSSGEFDHWFPHWMGGSDSSKNIWFEPHVGKFGSLAKDKVELLLYWKVCMDKTMTLDDAKALYLKGWTRLVTKK